MFDETGDTVATRNNYRARLVLETSPEMPYNYSATPVLRFERHTVSQVTELGDFEVPASILAAAENYGPGSGAEMFARYLRIFHGASDVEFWHSGDGWYVTFDTAAYREQFEITDEWLAHVATAYPGQKLVEMAEFKSWCAGDVYGVIIEERHPVKADRSALDETAATLDPSASYADVVAAADAAANDDEDAAEWAEVDAVWGFYGHTYAVQAATERLAEHVDAQPTTGTCRHCGRAVTLTDGAWIDPAATGDDSTWRETCDAHDTFTAEHDGTPQG